ncbi:ABC transporter ATP-binding protein/permease [Sporomusa aerivorans]|uniref:ABC transporter ATP-binding protein/permease n=1 Tax=Sporomusa aerivorans TaxID=204936 RepID=UPI003529DFBE
MALSFWLSAAAPKAWLGSILLILCTGLLVFLHMHLNNWQVGFYNHLQQHSQSGFYHSLLNFASICSVLVITSGWQTHFKMLLQLRWRQWLTTEFIALWLHNQSYFHMRLAANAADNPDQRIGEDIQIFVSHSLELTLGLLRQMITLCLFSAVLWQLSGEVTVSLFETEIIFPGYLVWFALLYSVMGTWATMQIGHPLMLQNNVQQSNEASFRYGLVRIKEYAECIALYKGEAWEQCSLLKSFSNIIGTYLAMIRTTRNVTWLSTAYAQLSTVFAFLIASPKYFNDELQLGQLFEIAGAYWYVHSALSYIIDSFGKIAQWQAVKNRLEEFYLQLIKIPQREFSGTTLTCPNKLTTQELSIKSPDGHTLVDKLTTEVSVGDSLLIIGPSGCGKTTLLQTLAGIWPYFDGQIFFPSEAVVLFLPQKPYLPIGTLRQAVLYPVRDGRVAKEKVAEVLHMCKLSALIPFLDTEADWSKSLSQGELQRLSIARAIVHQPKWVFLDETTSCIDTTTEAEMYQLLKKTLSSSSLISIGHRTSLMAYHRRVLELDGAGGWRFLELGQQYSK